MRIVRRGLKTPGELAGVGVERDDAAGPWVVAGTHRSVQHRSGIPRAHVKQIELRIVGARHPHLSAGGAAAPRARRSGRRRAVEDPLCLPRIGIDGLQGARQVVEIARHADQQMVADDERRVGRPEPASGVRDLDVPFHFARVRVERDEMGVGRGQVYEVLVDGGPAMADVEALIRRIGIAPELARRARVERPDVVRGRHVDHAVHQDRRRLDLLRLSRLKRPRQRELADVRRRDLGQRAVALTRIVAVIGRPTVR